MRDEAWPKQADKSEDVEGFVIYVYENVAHVNAPVDWECTSESPMDAATLRKLAAELVWAAERLEAR